MLHQALCDRICFDMLIFKFSAFNLEFYTDVQDLSYLQYHLDQDPRSAKYRYRFLLTPGLFIS